MSSAPDREELTEWEAYSDYQAVSKSVAESVATAIEHYTWLDSIHREQKTSPKSDQIALARSGILGAALKLFVEMKEEHETGNEEYDDILARWVGVDELDSDTEVTLGDVWNGEGAPESNGVAPNGNRQQNGDVEGYVRAFQHEDLDQQVPDWVLRFVTDIRTAAWKLGYLQAGRRSRKEPEDPVEGDARSMLRGG